jgi:hypothetical protein
MRFKRLSAPTGAGKTSLTRPPGQSLRLRRSGFLVPALYLSEYNEKWQVRLFRPQARVIDRFAIGRSLVALSPPQPPEPKGHLAIRYFACLAKTLLRSAASRNLDSIGFGSEVCDDPSKGAKQDPFKTCEVPPATCGGGGLRHKPGR